MGSRGSTLSSSSQRRLAKLSSTATSWPRRDRYMAVGQPRYPSPPRIRTFILPPDFCTWLVFGGAANQSRAELESLPIDRTSNFTGFSFDPARDRRTGGGA